MLPCYEPVDPDTTLLLGMEWVRETGDWPVLRHVFEVEDEAGLVVDLDPLGDAQAYAVGYTFTGAGEVRERFLPL
jgi:hypothetical protein